MSAGTSYLPLDLIRAGIDLVIIGRRLDPLFLLLTLPALLADMAYNYLLPLGWGLLVQHPVLGVGELFYGCMMTAITVGTTPISGYFKDRKTSQRTDVGIPVVEETNPTRQREKETNKEVIQLRKQLPQMQATLQSFKESTNLTYEALLYKAITQESNLRILQQDFDDHRAAFILSVEDLISLRRMHDQLQDNYSRLSSAHESLMLTHEQHLCRAEEYEKHMRSLKDAIIVMKGKMMALPIVVDDSRKGLFEGEEDDGDGEVDGHAEKQKPCELSTPAQSATSLYRIRIGETLVIQNYTMAFPKRSEARDAPLWARRGQRMIGPMKFRKPNFTNICYIDPARILSMIVMPSKRFHTERLPTTKTNDRNEVGITWPRFTSLYE
jgi:hypothetical protein